MSVEFWAGALDWDVFLTCFEKQDPYEFEEILEQACKKGYVYGQYHKTGLGVAEYYIKLRDLLNVPQRSVCDVIIGTMVPHYLIEDPETKPVDLALSDLNIYDLPTEWVSQYHPIQVIRPETVQELHSIATGVDLEAFRRAASECYYPEWFESPEEFIELVSGWINGLEDAVANGHGIFGRDS